MKKNTTRLITIIVSCVVAVAVFLIGFFYIRSVSDKIFVDSTDQLKETYKIVERSTRTYIEQKWRILRDWRDEIGPEFDFAARKDEWRFSQFYFFDRGGSTDDNIKFVTPSGASGTLTLHGFCAAIDEILSGNSSQDGIMIGGKESGNKITCFAIPVEAGEFDGTHYDSIGISFSNVTIAYALNTNPYGGEAKCFVVHSDGEVVFSMEKGGDIFDNYLEDRLKNPNYKVDPDVIAKIESDWNGKVEDLIRCNVRGESYCIYYQPLGFQDYVLLSVVPQSTISSGFLSVQRSTTIVFVIIFLLIGATVVSLLIFRLYRQSRKSRTELEYREQMFDVLSNSVDDIFIMFDPETQTVDYISPNIEALLGIPLEAARKDIRLIAKCAVNFNIVIPRTELEEIPVGGNKYWECEYMHQSTGERRWYRVTIYHMSILDVKKCIVVMSDRTVEQQMNQKLKEAFNAARSANEAKSNFLSNMSHDIRTPMNAIVGFSVLLEKDADDPEKVREYTRKITASSHHLLSLINDVLDMSKIESGKTSLNVGPFSLPEVLEELSIIIMPQAKAKTQEFTMQVKGNPPEQLVGDKLRLHQILINLLSNAVKYTQVGGKIEFSVAELSSPSEPNVKLRFVVRDNGIGMSKEFLEQIFAPFSREINSVTNKIQGTGLGMAITKNLVDLMGGIITVESEPGKGSTFVVEMSFARSEPEEADMWYKHKVARILVADDEEDICLNIKEMLRDTGVDVMCVFGGADAVDAAVKAHERGEDFDVILLDWKMPPPDGVETARLIRAKVGEDVPILVLTSYDWSEIESEARDAGINAFMSKPFFTSTFWQTIKPLFVEREQPLDKPVEAVMKDRTFLIVEDNELNAEILTEMLAMEGAKSELAVNGLEAVEKFMYAPPDHFDMILMDVQMPVMNGYEATKKIRSSDHPRAKTIPIVAMTANAFAEDVRNAFDAGMDGHLSKPINMDSVRELIAKLINKQNETDGGNDR